MDSIEQLHQNQQTDSHSCGPFATQFLINTARILARKRLFIGSGMLRDAIREAAAIRVSPQTTRVDQVIAVVKYIAAQREVDNAAQKEVDSSATA